MNPEDETFLSAFLDGELDPDQRVAVESALVSNPILAEHLRELSSVRDLVASLPHPSSRVDLSASVLARIRQGPNRRVGARRWAFAGTVGGGLAAAAAAVVLAVGGLPSTAPRPLATTARPSVASTPPVARNPEVTVRSVGTAGGTTGAAPDRMPEPRIVRTLAARDARAGRDDAAIRRDRDQAAIRERLLDSPDLTHIFIVLDVIGGRASERVNDLVRNAPRLDPAYGRIVVRQGITLDPRHPEKATVYALVLDEREMTELRKTLTDTFPGSVREEAPDPGVVTRLSDIGDVAVFSGTKASELLDPSKLRLNPGTLATRLEPKAKAAAIGRLGTDEFPEFPVREADPLPPAGENPAEARTDPERELSAPPATPGAPVEPSGPTAVAKAEPPARAANDPPGPRLREGAGRRKASIVLVWVTTPRAVPTRRD